MLYYKKYLKYKNKYLELKFQSGGNYTLNLEEWTEIENSGQKNCGIFLSKKYPDYILKCNESDNYKSSWVNEINQQVQLFPKIINDTIINEESYTTMQKLDGDITSIFFNLFPKIILDKMLIEKKIDEEQKKNLLIIFEGKILYTTKNLKSFKGFLDTELSVDYLFNHEIFNLYIQYLQENPKSINKITEINIKGKTYEMYNYDIKETQKKYETQKKIIEIIKKIQNISFELYNSFMIELIEMRNNYYEIIIKEIIKIKLKLWELNYYYDDNKFDNYGYILSNEPKINDYRTSNVPKIFDKYFYIYILDPESGLYKIEDSNDLEDETQNVIEQVNIGMKNYSIFGQYSITRINSSVINPYINIKNETLNLLGLNDDMIKILDTDYTFDIAKFTHNFTNIDEIKGFVYTPVNNLTPVNEFTPVNNLTPVNEFTPINNLTPVNEFTPINNLTPVNILTINDINGGHSDDIYSIVFHPTSPLLATGSKDMTVKLWQLSSDNLSAKNVATLRGHSGPVWSVAFHPTAPLMATGSSDMTVRLWLLSSNNLSATCVAILTGYTDEVLCVAFHPTAHLLATSTYNGIIKFWKLFSDNLTAENVATFKANENENEYAWDIWSIAFHPTMPLMVIGGMGLTAKLWQLSSDNFSVENVANLGGHSSCVWAVAFHPTKFILATTGGFKDSVNLWKLSSDNLSTTKIATLVGHKQMVRSIAFHPKAPLIATSSFDRTVKLWQMSSDNLSATCLATLDHNNGMDKEVYSVAFHPTAPLLITGGMDGIIKFWIL